MKDHPTSFGVFKPVDHVVLNVGIAKPRVTQGLCRAVGLGLAGKRQHHMTNRLENAE